MLELESAKDAEAKIIQEVPLPVGANFRQRATLDTAIVEIRQEDEKHRRVTSVTFSIQPEPVQDRD